MAKIQIVSDTHLEFRGDNFKNLIKPSAPILFLLGDISACGQKDSWLTYQKFIKYLSPQFKHIFHVPGNHEYYTSNRNITLDDTISGIDSKLKKFAKTIHNLNVLNNDTIRLKIGKKTYVFIGTTLWSNVAPYNREYIGSRMNDYSYLFVKNTPTKTPIEKSNKSPFRHFNVDDMSKLHIKSVRYVSNVLKKIKPNEIAILLTHHKPVRDKPITDLISQAYETALQGIIIKKPLRLACWGHTHQRYDKVINGVRCISNPKGYPNEVTLHKPDFTVTI
jgi:predicted phosphodiesterase